MLAFAVTAPVIGPLAPAFIHVVHRIVAWFVTIGLNGLLAEEPGDDERFEGSFGG